MIKLSVIIFKFPYWVQKLLRFLPLRKNWTIYNLWLKPNWGDRTFRYYLKGAYGFEYSNHLKQINYPFVYLDIGANQGLYSLLAIKNKSCIKAYAFEPVRSIYSILEKNILLNNGESKIKGVNSGISDGLGIAEISFDPAHSGKSSLSFSGEGVREEIQTVNYDSLNSFIKVPNEACVICKIDVEGFEEVVINQLLATKFSANIKEIMFEVHEGWIALDKVKDQLVRNGFITFERIGKGSHYDLLAKK